MASGRYGGRRDHEFRDRDADLEYFRKKGYYHQHYLHRDRHRDRNGDLREKLRAGRGRDSESDAVNGSLRSLSGGSSNSNDGGGDRVENRVVKRATVDREPGELSSGSGSDDSVAPYSKEKLDGKQVNGVLPSPNKKRKFSPIVWDGHDTPKEKKELSGSNPLYSLRRKNEQPRPNPLPLPPILAENHFPTSSAEAVKQSEDLVMGQEAEVCIDLPENIDHELGQMEIEDDYFVPARHISSSRWADANDTDDVATEDFHVDISPRKKNNASVNATEQHSQKKPSLELGEREVSEEASSKSSVSRTDDDDEMDVDNNDHMNIDAEEDTKRSGGVSCSNSDMDEQDERTKNPEPSQPPQRCINMLLGCRSVDEFERLNKIDEGTYGVVYRAKDKKTGKIVALKKVKMEKEREGFPLTSLREINILLSLHHRSIVDVKEVVVGSNLDSIFMVMEYMEHDLKGLMETMKQPFSQSEVKCLMLQLFKGVKYLHDNWVLHRDLKTSNLLLNNCGELKICDFGLSRQYSSPLKPYTHLVVTLWYRAPELLLGAKKYSTAIDMWSLGCIMAELLAKEPLFNGKTEFDQLDKIFRTLGTPNEKIWPEFPKLPGVKVNFVKQPYNRLRQKFPVTSFLGRPTLSESGFDLLNKLLTYDPEKRITAEAALNHPWFCEVPLPKSKDFMPTFPAQHAQDRRLRRVLKSPDPLEEQRRKELQQGVLGTGGLFG